MAVITDYSKISFLLPGNKYDSRAYPADLGPHNHAPHEVNDAVAESATETLNYSSSLYLPGNSGRIVYSPHPSFIFGGNDFTVRCKAFWPSVPGSGDDSQYLLRQADIDSPNYVDTWILALGYDSGAGGAHLYATLGTGSGENVVSGSVVISANTWYDIEYTRSGNTLYLLIDGALDQSLSISSWSDSGGALYIGHDPQNSNRNMQGYIEDLLITNGQSLHGGATFAVPGPTIKSVSNTGSGGSPVTDDAGNPASGRTVVAVPRSYPVRGFQTTTDASGEFSIDVPDAEMDVIAQDDDAGTQYNDLIHSRVVPA